MKAAAAKSVATQVYDMYLVDIENVPGWWSDPNVLREILQSTIDFIKNNNPGLEIRPHWIRRLAYGRDPYYMPISNRASVATNTAAVPLDYTYRDAQEFVSVAMPTGWDDGSEWSFAVEADDEGTPRFAGTVSLRDRGHGRRHLMEGLRGLGVARQQKMIDEHDARAGAEHQPRHPHDQRPVRDAHVALSFAHRHSHRHPSQPGNKEAISMPRVNFRPSSCS